MILQNIRMKKQINRFFHGNKRKFDEIFRCDVPIRCDLDPYAGGSVTLVFDIEESGYDKIQAL